MVLFKHMSDASQQVIGVKQFVDILNETLGFAFPLVTVEGEVHSYKLNQGKWVFFDLKDAEATLGCFMPIYQLKVPLEDGMNVRVTGTPRLTKWGKFSFTARSVELAGEGELRRAFALLKERLGAEGLFDESRKRDLPAYPQRIGLITSAQSAAYSDFIKILGQRWGGLSVEVADIQVQGAPAPGQVVAALNYFNLLASPVDVVVLIRGGGSLEDLQAFNTEEVARAVASSRTPVVVGVGHEIDVSLADYAADVRASTPTDAARLVVPDRQSVGQAVEFRCNALERKLGETIKFHDRRIDQALGQVERFLQRPAEQLDNQSALLRREYYRFELRFNSYGQSLEHLYDHLQTRQSQLTDMTTTKVESLERVLRGFSPQANLERGYAIVTKGSKVVRLVKQAAKGDRLMIQLADGRIHSQVEETL